MVTAAKKTYQILVNRYGMFEFAVDANSPEDACKILQRELRAGELKKARGGSEPIEAFWADPQDKGDAWAVMCSTRESGQTHAPILAWDGVKVMKSKFPDVAFDDMKQSAVGGTSKQSK